MLLVFIFLSTFSFANEKTWVLSHARNLRVGFLADSGANRVKWLQTNIAGEFNVNSKLVQSLEAAHPSEYSVEIPSRELRIAGSAGTFEVKKGSYILSYVDSLKAAPPTLYQVIAIFKNNFLVQKVTGQSLGTRTLYTKGIKIQDVPGVRYSLVDSSFIKAVEIPQCQKPLICKGDVVNINGTNKKKPTEVFASFTDGHLRLASPIESWGNPNYEEVFKKQNEVSLFSKEAPQSREPSTETPKEHVN